MSNTQTDEPNKKLSILTLNQKWFVDELREKGHRVVTAGWPNIKPEVEFKSPGESIFAVLDRLPRGFQPDRIIYYDNSGPIGITGFEQLEIPSLFYSIDAHHHGSWHAYWGGVFDRVLIAQRDYVEEFEEINPNSFWMPLWAPIILEPVAEKTTNVSFRGNLKSDQHPDRAKFFNRLAEFVEVDTKTGPYTEIYPSSKIVLNQNVKNDVNFRTYEGMVSGAMMLTPCSSNGLEDLFVPGRDLVTYEPGNAEDAAQKILYYLENDAEREEIAKRGREKIIERHTPKIRADQLEQHLLGMSKTERPLANFCAGVTYLVASNICRKHNEVLANRFLVFCAQVLRRSAQQMECANSEFEAAVLKSVFMLEDYNMDQLAIELSEVAFEAYSSSQLLAVCYLEGLSRRGRHRQAREAAMFVSSEPDLVLMQSKVMIEKLREGLLHE